MHHDTRDAGSIQFKMQVKQHIDNICRVFQPKTTKASLPPTATTNSPLLILPREIRDQIFNYLIGSQTLHICNPEAKNITHSVCKASESERDARLAHRLGWEPNEDRRLRSYTYRHSLCFSLGWKRPSTRSSFQLSLSLLRVSQQVYQEASYLLWTSNLFLFSKPETFTGFISARSREHRALIRRVGIRPQAPLCGAVLSNEKRGLYDDSLWVSGLEQLTGLSTLFLSLQVNLPESALKAWFTGEEISVDDLPLARAARCLPLKDVSVCVEAVGDFEYLRGIVELDLERKIMLGKCIEAMYLRKPWQSRLGKAEVDRREQEWESIVGDSSIRRPNGVLIFDVV